MCVLPPNPIETQRERSGWIIEPVKGMRMASHTGTARVAGERGHCLSIYSLSGEGDVEQNAAKAVLGLGVNRDVNE